MTDESTQKPPLPPVVRWLIGGVVVCALIMWGYAGSYRTLWWLGLLVGSVVIATLSLWVRDTLEYDTGFHTLADLTTRLFWLVAGLLFLFGVLVAGKTVLGPLVSAFTGPSYQSDELPENWRR